MPIDACYELVGRLRALWRGFDGGQEAHDAIDAFFAIGRSRPQPAGRRRDERPTASPSLDVVAEPYAAAPQLTARLRIEETTGQRVHAIALRCQVRIEPQRAPLRRRPRRPGCAACSASGSGGPTR